MRLRQCSSTRKNISPLFGVELQNCKMHHSVFYLWLFTVFLVFQRSQRCSVVTNAQEAQYRSIDELSADMPVPKLYENGPGKCKSNIVKCKNIKIDFCTHLCLWVYEGYLMLNVSFSVWIVPTFPIVFELGAIENDPNSKSNPPYLTGPWQFELNAVKTELINVKHFRFADNNPHLLRFQYRSNTTDPTDTNALRSIKQFVGNIRGIKFQRELPSSIIDLVNIDLKEQNEAQTSTNITTDSDRLYDPYYFEIEVSKFLCLL